MSKPDSKSFTGGCACGAVRYEVNDAPVFANHCQCLHCQKKSGTGHGSYLAFPQRAKVTLTGRVTHWDVAGDSGALKSHGFCPICGSPVYLTTAAAPDLFIIHAASLDDPGRFQPQAVTYASRAHGWDKLDPALPAFAAMPPM
jgi:hypothetical protein